MRSFYNNVLYKSKFLLTILSYSLKSDSTQAFLIGYVFRFNVRENQKREHLKSAELRQGGSGSDPVRIQIRIRIWIKIHFWMTSRI